MASISEVGNDTRGWILCVISAIACVAGACIVCVDVVIRLLPGKKNFQIQDSSAFLSSSLSLSFGVMIFSSLFSMLPSAKAYLLGNGHSDQAAGLLMMGGFILGFVGMQIISRIIHRFVPSHVVDCDHSHEDVVGGDGAPHSSHPHAHVHADTHGHDHHAHLSHTHFVVGNAPRFVSRKYFRQSSRPASSGNATESTPLISAVETTGTVHPGLLRQLSTRSDGAAATVAYSDGTMSARSVQSKQLLASVRRPSMIEVRDRVLSFVKDVKSNCDEYGPCFGYTDPCGQECKRSIGIRAPTLGRGGFGTVLKHNTHTAVEVENSHLHHPDWEESVPVVPEENFASSNEGSRRNSHEISPSDVGTVRHSAHDPRDDHAEMQQGDPQAFFQAQTGESSSTNVSSGSAGETAAKSDLRPEHDHAHDHNHGDGHDQDHRDDYDHDLENIDGNADDLEAGGLGHAQQQQQQHHHHVPSNAFLSIGLQTVLAIGLHKFPEGFITFATNHANPALGFNVFMALFVHNIAEGFSMALPLYMALNSRLRAILWAAALGGLSQPVGAGVAALWLKFLGRDGGDGSGNGTAYGVLFAITAGIMVAVALQLFVEGLTLHHNRQLSISFAFVGMILLGLSSALGTH